MHHWTHGYNTSLRTRASVKREKTMCYQQQTENEVSMHEANIFLCHFSFFLSFSLFLILLPPSAWSPIIVHFSLFLLQFLTFVLFIRSSLIISVVLKPHCTVSFFLSIIPLMAAAVEKPKVLIVGAGLGGLVLGALLEKADIPYLIFERTNTVKPLGKTSIPLCYRCDHCSWDHHRQNINWIAFFYLWTAPSGSAIAVGSNLLPLFIQLGIHDEFVALSRNVESCIVSREDKGALVHLDFSPKNQL